MESALSMIKNKKQDIANLYRVHSQVNICGVELEFVPIGCSQMGLIMKFVSSGLQGAIGTPQEIQDIRDSELFQRCLKKLAEVETMPSGKERDYLQNLIVSQMLTHTESSSCLHQLIAESFPAIVKPHELTDECKAAIATFFMERLAESFKPAT